jgi:4-carboxymuconolactone decarboxylase
MPNKRHDKGWETMRAIHGDVADATVRAMRDIAPEMGEFIVSFAFGDIYSRSDLDIKTRQICTMAMLAALGAQTAPQLKPHIQGALNVGWTKEEIVEVLMQTAVYAGFPAAISALSVAKKVFAESDKSTEDS